MTYRSTARRWLPALLAALSAGAAGCRDFVTGRAGFPIDVTLSRTAFGVGDSAEVWVTVFTAGGEVAQRASVRLTVSDTAVARLRGAWLVGRRPGRVEVRAESGGQAGGALAVVE